MTNPAALRVSAKNSVAASLSWEVFHVVERSRWPLTHRCTPRASPTLVRQQVARASERSRDHSIVFHEGICSASPTGPERLADHDVMLLETCRRLEVGQKTRGVGSSPSPPPPPRLPSILLFTPHLPASPPPFCSSAPAHPLFMSA